ncbi:universal stress protein [Halorhabdus sp. CBA1104]|uniref:universal stress protein n=1 Tax=unclassified Halorhabdus TaxID=2621901 RepID=UPI0012B21B0E|nr:MULTISPECIES: universal stress protein [unclassified Halorhabdus]QGN07073.1 universal stress protein [Halorhabdus sp. CBA1104]
MAVLVPYDSSEPARDALEEAVSEYGDERIVLLRVIEVADDTFEAGFNLIRDSLEDDPEELAADVADEVLSVLEATDGDYVVETTAGKPAREIVRYAEDHDIDRIVMGSHGRDGVSRILLGSVAEKIVRRSPVSVTVVR